MNLELFPLAGLAAADDALAAGQSLAEVPAELQTDLAFLEQLRRALRPSSIDDLHPTRVDTRAISVLSLDHQCPRLGRFEIRRELGRGGMGVVFLAYDPERGCEVALKVPLAETLANAAARACFRREAEASALLDHPAVVAVQEAGSVGPVCYLISAYCPGISLAQWLRQRRQPEAFSEAAVLVATLADAMQHAHERGVIHRDLKPANILLASRGCESPECGSNSGDSRPRLTDYLPKIIDFGLAKLLSAGAEPLGAIVGTPSYMAPEQAAGRHEAVGPAADIYALGVILYGLLTGRLPFQDETVLDVVRQVRTDERRPPSPLPPQVPRDLEHACLKCLEEPCNRYASARELADALRRCTALVLPSPLYSVE